MTSHLCSCCEYVLLVYADTEVHAALSPHSSISAASQVSLASDPDAPSEDDDDVWEDGPTSEEIRARLASYCYYNQFVVSQPAT